MNIGIGLGLTSLRSAGGGPAPSAPVTAILMGQSQMEYLLNAGSSYRVITQPTPGDGNLVVYTQSGAGVAPVKTTVNATTVAAGQVNPAMAAMSALLEYARPGVIFVVGDGSVPGKARASLYDSTTDGTDNWQWSDFAAVATAIVADYGNVGNLIENWYGSDETLLATFKASFWPFYFGSTDAGANVAIGSTVGGRQLDHIIWDGQAAPGDVGRGLFARTATKWHMLAPTPFADAPTAPTAEWDDFSQGSPRLSEPDRATIYALTGDALAQSVNLQVGPSAHICDVGGDVHPVTDDPDGQILMMWPIAVALLRASGRTIGEPVISAIEGPTDGSYVDVVVDLPNGGTLTTLREFRAGSMPGTPSPHQQEVTGFQIARSGGDVRPVYLTSETSYPVDHRGTVTITDTGSGNPKKGRARITPTTAFAFGDGVSYLRGQASAILQEPRDVDNKLYLDMLLEHIPSLYDGTALYPFEGVAVAPYQSELLAPVPAPAFTPRGAYFDGADYYGQTTGVSVPAGNSGLASVWFKNDDTSWNATTRALFAFSVGSTEVLSAITASSGRITVRVNNNTATDTISFQAASGVPFAIGTWYHLLVSWGGGTVRVYVNGGAMGTIAYSTIDMNGQNISRVGIGARANGANFWKGDLAHEYITVNQTLDLTVTANREKFALAGDPVDVGSDGSTPTGTAPEWYYDGDAPAWSNRGTAGDVTLTGTLDASSTVPSY